MSTKRGIPDESSHFTPGLRTVAEPPLDARLTAETPLGMQPFAAPRGGSRAKITRDVTRDARPCFVCGAPTNGKRMLLVRNRHGQPLTAHLLPRCREHWQDWRHFALRRPVTPAIEAGA